MKIEIEIIEPQDRIVFLQDLYEWLNKKASSGEFSDYTLTLKGFDPMLVLKKEAKE